MWKENSKTLIVYFHMCRRASKFAELTWPIDTYMYVVSYILVIELFRWAIVLLGASSLRYFSNMPVQLSRWSIWIVKMPLVLFRPMGSLSIKLGISRKTNMIRGTIEHIEFRYLAKCAYHYPIYSTSQKRQFPYAQKQYHRLPIITYLYNLRNGTP